MDKTVDNKWQTDGNLAVLYRVDNILLFYSTNKDPHFKSGQSLSQKQAQDSGFYKAIPYSNENLPSDAYVDLNFSWGKK